MFHIVLYQPEIPPNTGNIIRLCANVGATLHLIHPLGFLLNQKNVRRSGMDYRKDVKLIEHSDLASCQQQLTTSRWFAMTTKATHHYHEMVYQPEDVFLFGPETRGLPESVLADFSETQTLRLPMVSGSRSLNLSNSVAVMAYEAWRQQDFLNSQKIK